MANDQSKIDQLFAAIDARTAAMSPSEARAFLNTNREIWIAREADLFRWTTRPNSRPNPLPGLDAWGVALIITDIGARIAKFEDAARALAA